MANVGFQIWLHGLYADERGITNNSIETSVPHNPWIYTMPVHWKLLGKGFSKNVLGITIRLDEAISQQNTLGEIRGYPQKLLAQLLEVPLTLLERLGVYINAMDTVNDATNE